MNAYQVHYTGLGTALHELPLTTGLFLVISPLSQSALLEYYQGIDPNAGVRQMNAPQAKSGPAPEPPANFDWVFDFWADYDED